MLDAAKSVAGGTWPEKTPTEWRVNRNPADTVPKDTVEISDSARSTMKQSEYVQLLRDVPDVRPEVVEAAKEFRDSGLAFTEEFTDILSRKIIAEVSEP